MEWLKRNRHNLSAWVIVVIDEVEALVENVVQKPGHFCIYGLHENTPRRYSCATGYWLNCWERSQIIGSMAAYRSIER